MSLAPQDFFPGLAGWVATLDDVWPGVVIKPYFAQWEVGHLLLHHLVFVTVAP